METSDLAAVARAYDVDARGRLSMDGTFRQQDGEAALDARAELADFAHPMADAERLALDGKVRIAGATTSFDVKGSGERLRLDRIPASLLPRADLAATGRSDRWSS